MGRFIPMENAMKYVPLVAALATCVAFSASAMSPEIDTDGDGMASLVELQVSYPELTEEQFQSIDTDADGLVNEEEMAVAVESGIIADL